MISIAEYGVKLQRKLLKVRLQPIRVFCFHQVSDVFDDSAMEVCDWIQTDVFKQIVLTLRKKYTFVSLTEAKEYIKNGFFRTKNYAVLTADDGCSSIRSVIPWLAELGIPITLFINPCYLDGKHFRERSTEKYLSMRDLKDCANTFTNVSVALHGWEHQDMSSCSEVAFREDIEKSKKALSFFPCYIPFYAYPWGRHNSMNDTVLRECGLTPVLMDGLRNYSDWHCIHREMMKT